MDANLKEQILAFGRQYKSVNNLYGVYFRCLKLVQEHGDDISMLEKEWERLQLEEPLKETMLNYARQLSGVLPPFDEEINVMQRNLDEALNNPDATQEAIELARRNVEQAKLRDYESSRLVGEYGFLNQYGEYDRGGYDNRRIREYEKVLSFVRELNQAKDGDQVDAIRSRFNLFKRRLIERKYNTMDPCNGGSRSTYVRSFSKRYRRQRK